MLLQVKRDPAFTQFRMMADSGEAIRLLAKAIMSANRVPVPPPPVFDGRESGYTIDNFFILFERYAESLYGPKSQSWVLVLQGFLTGEPRQALAASGATTTDYDEMKRRIVNCCRTPTWLDFRLTSALPRQLDTGMRVYGSLAFACVAWQ